MFEFAKVLSRALQYSRKIGVSRSKNVPSPTFTIRRSSGPITSAKIAKREGIQGAQWSSVDDACPLCKYLDGMVISVDHPDFDKFRPPLHKGCQCIRIYINDDEEGVEVTWVTPPEHLMKALLIKR